jgi:hypothetical protein
MARGESHRAARARLHGERRRADLVDAVDRRLDGREQVEVADALLARAAARLDRDLRHRQRAVTLELGGLLLQARVRFEPEPDADVIEQPLPHRQPALGADVAA